jgi:hypothetical protein
VAICAFGWSAPPTSTSFPRWIVDALVTSLATFARSRKSTAAVLVIEPTEASTPT